MIKDTKGASSSATLANLKGAFTSAMAVLADLTTLKVAKAQTTAIKAQ